MSTKTYNSPTANLFDLLPRVDTDLPPEKRKAQGSKKPGDGPTQETPAEKAQRRKALENQKALETAAAKQKAEAEAALASQWSGEGFQVQKSQKQKASETKTKDRPLNREDFNNQQVQEGTTETTEKPKFVKGPGQPKKFEGGKPDGQKPFVDKRKPRENQDTRPVKHEGYDKHSGTPKTSNKPRDAKRKGEGQGNWGGSVPTKGNTGAWGGDDASTPAADGQAGWGDEPTSSAPPTTTSEPGWGDEDQPKEEKKEIDSPDPQQAASEKVADKDKEKKERRPDWDDEGFGKMTLEQFQATVAEKRKKELETLAGIKETRSIDQTIDLSKCSYKNTTDEKEKRLAEERKAAIIDERKKKGQQRAGTTTMEIRFEVKGGRGGGRGGRGGRGGGDRPQGDRPQKEGETSSGQQSGDASPQQRSPNPNRGRGGGGRGNRLPKSANAFPELPQVAHPPAAAAPKSTQ